MTSPVRFFFQDTRAAAASLVPWGSIWTIWTVPKIETPGEDTHLPLRLNHCPWAWGPLSLLFSSAQRPPVGLRGWQQAPSAAEVAIVGPRRGMAAGASPALHREGLPRGPAVRYTLAGEARAQGERRRGEGGKHRGPQPPGGPPGQESPLLGVDFGKKKYRRFTPKKKKSKPP